MKEAFRFLIIFYIIFINIEYIFAYVEIVPPDLSRKELREKVVKKKYFIETEKKHILEIEILFIRGKVNKIEFTSLDKALTKNKNHIKINYIINDINVDVNKCYVSLLMEYKGDKVRDININMFKKGEEIKTGVVKVKSNKGQILKFIFTDTSSLHGSVNKISEVKKKVKLSRKKMSGNVYKGVDLNKLKRKVIPQSD
jgi:hypothetical protein